MSKHTPGPWFIWQERAMREAGHDSDFIEDELLYQDTDHVILAGEPRELSCGHVKGCKQLVSLDPDDFDSRRESLANARLIAAAPDLLTVLQELEEAASYWSEYDVPVGLVDRLRAVIAKATGSAA